MKIPIAAGDRVWRPGRTYVLVIGITFWSARAVLPASTEQRRDVDLVDRFKAAGVPARNVVFVKDRAATRAGIRKALRTLAARSEPDDTFIFCFLGHGGRERLYCYDFDDKRAEETVFHMKEICPILLKSWKGNRLILIGDFCCSGSLGTVLRQFEKDRPETSVAVFASAMESSDSTLNWTFTEGLIRIFAGDPLADRDRDGRIQIAEAGRFLHDQMKFKENQLANLILSSNFEKDFVIRAVRAGRPIRKLPGSYQIGEILEARNQKGIWLPCEIAGGKSVRGTFHYKVRFCHTEESLDAARLRPIVKARLKVGAKYEVKWHNEWHPATVTRKLENYFYHVHYENDAVGPDEWITPESARILPGKSAKG